MGMLCHSLRVRHFVSVCQQFTMATTPSISVNDFLLSIFLITYLDGILEINEQLYFKLPVIVQKWCLHLAVPVGGV